MPSHLVVGISGNISRPSKTRTFVELIASHLAEQIGAQSSVFDMDDLGETFGQARRFADLDASGRLWVEKLVRADVLVVGSPTYKGSYTGLFKHFFDLLDPAALRGKPIILSATGGGERHSLIVEHQLRPLFGFFEALSLPTAIYASDRDFAEGKLVSEPILARVQKAVGEASHAIGRSRRVSLQAA